MGAVFVSYRREDSEGQARALSLELARILGKDSVFMDVDNIALGRDFRQVLQERLESCDVMLALIGPGWLEATDAAGNRRLDSPTDFVRQEIAAALKRNIPVIPVLVQRAQVPQPERLPDDLKDLSYRNGFELGHTTWESDVREMVTRLNLDGQRAAPAPMPAAPPPGRPASPSQPATAIASPRRGLIGAIAVIALAGVGLFVAFNPLSRDAVPSSAAAVAEPPSAPAGAVGNATPDAQPAQEPASKPGPVARQEAAPTRPATPSRRSLTGTWLASGCRGGLIVTADDGKRVEGECDTGILHRFVGTYTGANAIAITVTRIDGNKCESRASGHWIIENDNLLTTFQEGWNDPKCNVTSPAASETIRRLVE